MKFEQKIHIDVVKRDHIGSGYTENAYAHIEQVRAALDKIPEEFRTSAVFEISTWNDRDDVAEHAMRISYARPPTKEEVKQQIADARKSVADEIDWVHRRARDILREAAECGYAVPDAKWPFKADRPAPLDD